MARLTKQLQQQQQMEKIQIENLVMSKETFPVDITIIKRIISNHYNEICQQMGYSWSNKFLNLLKLRQEDIENPNKIVINMVTNYLSTRFLEQMAPLLNSIQNYSKGEHSSKLMWGLHKLKLKPEKDTNKENCRQIVLMRIGGKFPKKMPVSWL